MRYRATVGGRPFFVERTATGVSIDGRDLAFDPDRLGPGEVLLRFGTRTHHVSGERIDGGWAIRVSGKSIFVELEDERTHALRELTWGGTEGTGCNLRAPMPGRVIKILAEAGQTVTAGDGLMVIEAMKMENELRAEGPGIIAAVEVSAGDAVDRDDLLVRFEEVEA